MKIGDKVRFLSETGGGRIAGFKGNIVLVEDEDGFQIPTPINNVVLVGDKENYDSQNIRESLQIVQRTFIPEAILMILLRNRIMQKI